MAENSRRDGRGLLARHQNVLIGLVGLLLIVSTHWRWFGQGIPYTHDGQIHLTRIAQYYLTVKQDQIPPRWAAQLNNSFGYPVFNFNYPLFNMAAYLFIVIGLEAVTVYLLGGMLALALGYAGMYILLVGQTQKWPALMGALFYGLNPYVAQLVYVRGSVGELSAWALLPWVLFFLHHLMAKKKAGLIWYRIGFVLSASAFAISHNIMVMLASMLFFLYLVYQVFRRGRQVLFQVLPWVFLVGLIASFFWIPALLEKGYTVLDQAAITQGYNNHFVSVGQLFTGAWDYGYSYPGPVDGLSFRLGLSQWIVLGFAVLVAIKDRNKRNFSLLWAALGLMTITLSLTENIWKNFPLGTYIQFPWRFLMILQFFLAYIAAFTMALTLRYRIFWAGIGFLLLIQALSIQKPIDRVRLTNQDLFYATESTSTLDENMPIWFDKFKAYGLKNDMFKDSYVVAEKNASVIRILEWTGSHHEYEVELADPDRIIERSAFFPGWETSINGNTVPLEYDHPDYPGLITYRLDPGTYLVETNFTQNTPPRIIGNSLTALGLALFAGYCGWEMLKKIRLYES